MSLLEKIHEDLIQAQKEAKILEVSVLRMLLSAFHNKEIEKRSRLVKDKSIDVSKFSSEQMDELSRLEEKEAQDALRSEVKKRRESIELYQKGGRNDLVAKETDELKILEQYLPPSMSEQEIEKIVQEVIGQTGAKTKQDFGNVMKEAVKRIEGRAEGSVVSKLVQKFLS